MDTRASQLPLTIIIVDDNPIDAYLIRWVLAAHAFPHELQVIANGDHAIQVIEHLARQEHRQSPTVVLLDLNLPQRDGKEILRYIKSIAREADIRVVVVTGSTNPADRAETLALGADAFFVKPFYLTPFMQLGDVIKDVVLGPPQEG